MGLNMIFNLLGTPPKTDIDELEREDAKRYLNCFAAREGKGLEAKFSHASAESITFLRGMLQFTPKRRVSVQNALADNFFREVKDPSKERSFEGPFVTLQFEKEPDLT